MTPQEILAIIQHEVAEQWSRTNGYGCDQYRCLVAPVKGRFRNAVNQDAIEIVELWIVLEEDPITKAGYKIVFDEDTNEFGLATSGFSGDDSYLGPYGDFWTTFDSM
jgi:hypothetical protein